MPDATHTCQVIILHHLERQGGRGGRRGRGGGVGGGRALSVTRDEDKGERKGGDEQ